MNSRKRSIRVVPYDPNWPHIFYEEALQIQKILGKNCLGIHHIGSTSISGLWAKPIIDMIPVVKNICDVDSCNNKMQDLGYTVMGEFGMLFRRFFSKDGFNVHVYEDDSPEVDRHLKFRDWMRQHPKDASGYESLKRDLAEKYPEDPYLYCSGKDGYISSIDAKTGWHGVRFVVPISEKEIESYEQITGYDFRGHTKRHMPVVMYSGSNIVVAACLELLDNNELMLERLAIKPDHDNPEFSLQMMTAIKKWASHVHMKLL